MRGKPDSRDEPGPARSMVNADGRPRAERRGVDSQCEYYERDGNDGPEYLHEGVSVLVGEPDQNTQCDDGADPGELGDAAGEPALDGREGAGAREATARGVRGTGDKYESEGD